MEQFFLAVSSVPRFDARAHAILARSTFGETSTEIDAGLEVLLDACERVLSSTELSKVMQLTLAVGNYLNGGGQKGGAYGFKFSSLNKLNDTKSTDGKTNLLNMLIGLIDMEDGAGGKQGGGALIEIPAVAAAGRMVWKDECASLATLQSGVRQCEALVQSDKDAKFVDTIGTFVSEASVELSKLTAKKDKAEKMFSDLKAPSPHAARPS